MYHPIEKFTNRLIELQGKLEVGSKLYDDMTELIAQYWEISGSTKEVAFLCKLHQLLNHPENIKIFNELKQRKLIEEINTSILTVIRDNLAKHYKVEPQEKKDKKKVTTSKWLLFAGATLLGTLFATVDGFSIIQTIVSSISALSNIPNFILIPAQILFALAGAITFYAIESHTIGHFLGIKALHLGRVFKLYSKQADRYDEIFALMSNILIKENFSKSEFEKYQQTYAQIKQTYANFEGKVAAAKEAQSNPSTFKNAVEIVFTGCATFFCGALGALGAQTFLVSALPWLIGASAAAGPVGLGISIGLITVCFGMGALLYFMNKKGITKIVNRLWGTPSKSIENVISKDNNIRNSQDNVHKLSAKKTDSIALEEQVRYHHLINRKKAPDLEPQWQPKRVAENELKVSENLCRLQFTQPEKLPPIQQTEPSQQITVQ